MSYHQKYVPKVTKEINIKVFNMITNKNETKAMTENISCDCKCKFNGTVCNSNQEWNKTCQRECKNYRTCRKDYSWNPSTCISENSKYLKCTSVTECDEIISLMDIISTKETNLTITPSIKCHSIKVKDCYSFY